MSPIPAISAIVVNNETHAPGHHYYEVAHPGTADPLQREIAGANEYGRARATSYPDSL